MKKAAKVLPPPVEPLHLHKSRWVFNRITSILEDEGIKSWLVFHRWCFDCGQLESRSIDRAWENYGKCATTQEKEAMMPDFKNDLAWTCHVCNKERPDHRISVLTNDRSKEFKLPDGTMTENIRYCNDDATCIEGAKLIRFWDKPED